MANCLSVAWISLAMLNVEPSLEQPPVSLTRATEVRIDRPLKPVALDSCSRRPAACSFGVGPANSRSITPVAGVPGSTGRSTAVTNGGLLAANRAGFSKYTFFITVRNGVRMSITIRLGWVSVDTWNDVLFASPIPWDTTASKSPDRTTVMTPGSANAIRPGVVACPALLWTSAGDKDLTVADDAWVIFTSGSTGKPKGVAVSHRSAAAFVDAETHLWSVRPDDRVLAGLSVGFDASCEEMWLAWRSGAALVPAPRSLVRAAGDLGPWLAANRVSVVSTVPTLAAMWDEADIAGVRLLIFGGEACPDALAWRLANDREVWNTYGPTEATVVATAARLRPGKPVTIGWPLHGWEIAIVDERGETVALGEPGELVIGGVGLARYLDPGARR